MIVVATEDFELYHGLVTHLRERHATFTTIEPTDELPEGTAIVLTGRANAEAFPNTHTIVADPAAPREAISEAMAALRQGASGRTVIGVDPGRRPGIAVLIGGVVTAAFQVPLADAVETITRELESVDMATAGIPVIRIGDGSRLESAKLVNELEDVRVELVDETGTTPSLGTGARGMGDVLAAVNIGRLEGEVVTRREIEPTAGELQVIKDRSREQSETNRAIDESLARRVAAGELTVGEALAVHRDGDRDRDRDRDHGRGDGTDTDTDPESADETL